MSRKKGLAEVSPKHKQNLPGRLINSTTGNSICESPTRGGRRTGWRTTTTAALARKGGEETGAGGRLPALVSLCGNITWLLELMLI